MRNGMKMHAGVILTITTNMISLKLRSKRMVSLKIDSDAEYFSAKKQRKRYVKGK